MAENYIRKAQAVAEISWKKMNDCSLTAGKDLGRLPEIRFKKLKGAYGFAYPDHIELDQNTVGKLSEKELDKFLERTTIHELAHVAEYRINKVMSHGPVWHGFDHAGGGIGLQYGYSLEEQDWFSGESVGPAWAILQLMCFCAFVVFLSFIAKYFLSGISVLWLILPIIAGALLGNVTLDAVFVRNEKDLQTFCAAKFLILVPLAVYLLLRI